MCAWRISRVMRRALAGMENIVGRKVRIRAGCHTSIATTKFGQCSISRSRQRGKLRVGALDERVCLTEVGVELLVRSCCSWRLQQPSNARLDFVQRAFNVHLHPATAVGRNRVYTNTRNDPSKSQRIPMGRTAFHTTYNRLCELQLGVSSAFLQQADVSGKAFAHLRLDKFDSVQ